MPPKKAAAKAKPAAPGTRKSSRAVPAKAKAAIPEPEGAPIAASKRDAAPKRKRGSTKPAAPVVFPNLKKPKKQTAEPDEEEEEEEEVESSEAAAPKKGASKKGAPKKGALKKAAAAKKAAGTKAKKAQSSGQEDGEDKEPPKTGAATKRSRVRKESSASVTAPRIKGKRKANTVDADETEVQADEDKPKAKKARTEAKPAVKKAGKGKTPKVRKLINPVPVQRLDVYVFGENSAGELGLGHMKLDGKSVLNVKRPRLNPLLNSRTVGVVAIATGGMHCIALTRDNKILTWGVNDQGALGRDTSKQTGSDDGNEAGLDEDDSGLNPHESAPGVVDNAHFPEGTVFVEVAASDSASFVLTGDGLVYGWGTFRGNDGVIGFTPDIRIAYFPIKIDALSDIKHISVGSNHAMALDLKGKVYGWGAGQQSQLGRRTVERLQANALVPREFGLPNKPANHIEYINCGSFHTFAIDTNKAVWSWGLNNFAGTGLLEGAGEDDRSKNSINRPTIVESLKPYVIKEIKGGGHHSVACTENGELLAWGRVDGYQVGVDLDDIPKDFFMNNERGEPRICKIPVVIPDINAVFVTASTDSSIAIDAEGRAYSWGFSTNFQTGQGTMEDVKEATLIDNTAVRDVKLNWAGIGGQYGILTAIAEYQGETANGVDANA